MIFLRHDYTKKHSPRTSAEKCAQFGALFGTLLIIIAGILLYFAITTEYSEQKSIYFIVAFLHILALLAVIALTIYYVRKYLNNDEVSQHQQQLDQRNKYKTNQHHYNGNGGGSGIRGLSVSQQMIATTTQPSTMNGSTIGGLSSSAMNISQSKYKLNQQQQHHQQLNRPLVYTAVSLQNLQTSSLHQSPQQQQLSSHTNINDNNSSFGFYKI